jgi:preprotein translocase subunit SecG
MILAAFYHPILATLFAFVAIVLMGVILLQRGKGVGLSGAFGGAGGHTAFGAKTGDVLTWATVAAAVLMLTFAVVLNYVFVPLSPFGPPAAITGVPGAGTGTPVVPAGTPSPGTPGPPVSPPSQDKQVPEGSWNPGERASWPPYARVAVFENGSG